MRKFLLLFAVFLLLIEVQGLSKFHFNGNLGCRLDKFCYHIEVYEQDWVENSDDLLTNQTEIVSVRPHKYQVDAQDTSDGVDLLRKFEVYMLIYHTCSSDGRMKKLRHDWGEFDIDVCFWEVTKSKDLELFNQGENV